MTTIFAFSDTHEKPLSPALVSVAEESDFVFFLGDGARGIGDLALHKGFYGVKGNCDFDSDGYRVGALLQEGLDITLFGKAFHLSHKPPTRLGYQGYLFGHTHHKTLYQDGGAIYCNPGSIALPRDGKESFALMDESGIRLIDASDLQVIERLGF